jgi:transmembrane sensor
MDYRKYEVEDFVVDESFQAYVTGKEKKVFWDNLKNSSSEIRRKIEEAEKIVDILYQMKPDLSEDEYNDEYVRFKHMIWQTGDEFVQIDRTPRSKMSIFIIAVAILALTGAGYMFFKPSIHRLEPKAPQMVTKYNPAGQKSTIFLNDGSTVVLNSGSRITVSEVFTPDTRSVKLEGEAFFDVVRDSRPFEVITGQYKTIVVGTSFNIQNYDEDETTVSLASGQVVVVDTITKELVPLQPGQKVDFFKDKVPQVSNFDPQVELAWKNGEIVFENAGLTEVKKKLERWYGVTIEIYNGENEEWNVKGRFKNESLQRVLESLSFTQGFNYNLNGKKVVIIL